MCALVVLVTAGRVVADGPNVLRNADFVEVDQHGMPQHWQVNFQGHGGNKVNGQTSLVQGPEGKPALRTECITRKSPYNDAAGATLWPCTTLTARVTAGDGVESSNRLS